MKHAIKETKKRIFKNTASTIISHLSGLTIISMTNTHIYLIDENKSYFSEPDKAENSTYTSCYVDSCIFLPYPFPCWFVKVRSLKKKKKKKILNDEVRNSEHTLYRRLRSVISNGEKKSLKSQPIMKTGYKF